MSFDPSKVVVVLDLFDGNGASTGTRAGGVKVLPPGKKAVQVTSITSSTLTIKIQNSLDQSTWFDVTSSTPASTTGVTLLAEVDSVIPYWRVNVTSHTTSGTGTASMVAMITQGPV
jgi:hypothetical protein